MKLFLPLTFLFIISCQVFSQDFTIKKEKIPVTSEDLINARSNEGKTQLLSDNEQMRLVKEQFLTEIYVVDEWILQQWNTGTNMWDNYAKYDPIYSPQDLLIDDRILGWNGSSWENSSRHFYTYTGTNLEATNTYQTWGGVDWINVDRKSTSYDVSNRPVEYLYETWSGASWNNWYRYQEQYNTQGKLQTETYQTWSGAVWVNDTRYSYTYNSNDLITEILVQNWTGAWTNTSKETRTYDAMGHILTKIDYTWSGGWQNSYQYLYTYDGNGNNTILLIQNWDPIYTWVNYSQNLNQYDGNNNLTEELNQLWNGGTNSWNNYHKYNFTYNAQKAQLTALYQLWNTGTGWEPTSYVMSTYDMNNNLSERIFQQWNGTAWVNFLRQTGFIWILITDVEDEGLLVDEFKLYNNYPNPFNPSTKIKFNVPSISNVTIKVFDITGTEIKVLVNQTLERGLHEIEFSGNGLASGIYFYEIQAHTLDGEHTFVDTRKMTLLK